jgi:hypothetical protein
MNRLYEQGADAIRIGDYVRRWWTWVRSGLAGEVALRTFVTRLDSNQMPYHVAVEQGQTHRLSRSPKPAA